MKTLVVNPEFIELKKSDIEQCGFKVIDVIKNGDRAVILYDKK